jgi:hypothetical protein
MEALRAFAESVGYNTAQRFQCAWAGSGDYVRGSDDDDDGYGINFNTMNGDGNFDIMVGVVTECAGGAIEEIRWREFDLDGTLPVGDLNMPKLRVLDLYGNSNLKGERESELK